MNKHILTLLKLAFILFLSNVCLCLHAQETEDEEKEEGEAMINHLLSLDSTSAELLFGAGRFHMEHGEYDEAIQYFNRSLHYLPLKNKKSYGVHYEKKNIDSAAVYKLTAHYFKQGRKTLTSDLYLQTVAKNIRR